MDVYRWCARRVDSRLRGNDGLGHRPSGLRIKSAMTGWWDCLAITLCSQYQALGQALVLCHQGKGDSTSPPPCGLTSLRSRCASVCACNAKALSPYRSRPGERPAYAGMTVCWCCLAITLTFDSSPIKGKGILSVGVVLLLPRPVDSRLRGNDGPGWLALYYCHPLLPCQALGQA